MWIIHSYRFLRTSLESPRLICVGVLSFTPIETLLKYMFCTRNQYSAAEGLQAYPSVRLPNYSITVKCDRQHLSYTTGVTPPALFRTG